MASEEAPPSQCEMLSIGNPAEQSHNFNLLDTYRAGRYFFLIPNVKEGNTIHVSQKINSNKVKP